MNYNDYNRFQQQEPVIETEHFTVSEPVKAKKRHLGVKIVAGCLVCALVGGIAGGAGVMVATSQQTATADETTLYEGSRPTSAVSMTHVDGSTILTPEEIYNANLAAIVGVNGNVTTNVWGQTVRNATSGSGFVVSTDGYIITNYHVIDGVEDITVSFADGSTYDAVVVGGEEENDIAVLKIEAEGLTAVVLGDSDALSVGEPVVAIGNPLGELTFSLTVGYVSAKDRSITVDDGTIMNMIQTDVAINSGNSGGPLFDQYGQVVGIVSAKYSGSSSSSTTIEGIGFAIPFADVDNMVTDIIEYGYVTGKPNVGVLMNDVDSTASMRYGIPQGVYVEAVLEGSCADAAGITQGDIITGVDESLITTSDQLSSAIKTYRAGDSVTFEVYRNGETMTVEAILDESNQDRTDDMEALYNSYLEAYQEQYQQQQQQSSSWPNGW